MGRPVLQVNVREEWIKALKGTHFATLTPTYETKTKHPPPLQGGSGGVGWG